MLLLVGWFRQPERESRLSNSSTNGRLHVVISVDSRPTEIRSPVCSSCENGLRKIDSKLCPRCSCAVRDIRARSEGGSRVMNREEDY